MNQSILCEAEFPVQSIVRLTLVYCACHDAVISLYTAFLIATVFLPPFRFKSIPHFFSRLYLIT